MSTTPVTSDVRDWQHYRGCPPKRGYAAQKKLLIEQLREAETCYFHSVIMTSKYGNDTKWEPPAEWVEKRETFKAEAQNLRDQLEQIVGPWQMPKHLTKP